MELRPIPGYEGRYSVTADGRVWSEPKAIARRAHSGMWLSPGLSGGYQVVCLTDDHGGRSMKRVHRLVAMAWIPNLLGLPQINHLDGNRINNRKENLEWSTQAENVFHAYEIGLRPSSRKLNDSQVTQVREMLKLGQKGKEIAALFQVSPSLISEIKNSQYAKRDSARKENHAF